MAYKFFTVNLYNCSCKNKRIKIVHVMIYFIFLWCFPWSQQLIDETILKMETSKRCVELLSLIFILNCFFCILKFTSKFAQLFISLIVVVEMVNKASGEVFLFVQPCSFLSLSLTSWKQIAILFASTWIN